ncbi:50S ribosomal protein L10 [Clostridia bacterium]|nr:50S ribosomal protein L10 [Clostridia bacterium]
MPNARVLEEKKQVVANLVEKMKNASCGVLVDYKGINVEEDTKLRRKLREAGIDYSVVKNTLTRFAANELGFAGLDPILNGTTAMAVSSADQTLPAKILCEYAQKSGDKFTIKAGFVDGKVISAEEVKTLAELPPREVLVARALAGFNAPIAGLVNVLNGNIRGLVVALQAVADKKAQDLA